MGIWDQKRRKKKKKKTPGVGESNGNWTKRSEERKEACMTGFHEKDSSAAWGEGRIDRQEERGKRKEWKLQHREKEVSWYVLLQQGKGLTETRKGLCCHEARK